MPPKTKPVSVKAKAAAGVKPKAPTGGKPKAAAASKTKAPGGLPKAAAVPAASNSAADKDGEKPTKPKITDLNFKDLANVLKDEKCEIRPDPNKWLMLIDPSGKASIYFRYQGGNYVDTLNPSEVQPERLRQMLLGAIRYGKEFILDFADADMYDVCVSKFDEIHKGLMDDVMDKTIREKFPYLIKDSDGDEYDEKNFSPLYTKNFQLVVLTKIEPKPQLLDKFCVMRVING